MRIGVLCLQGDFLEHMVMLKGLGAEAVPVRLPRDVDGLEGLILPGGESTTMGRLMAEYQLGDKIREMAERGLPLWGTCAGMILLAREARGSQPPLLGLMDITVQRNAFGRQRDSFEEDVEVPALGQPSFHAVFIRAPVICDVGPSVEVLARLPDKTAVAVRQGNLLATAFHPELTPDPRFHAYFSKMKIRKG